MLELYHASISTCSQKVRLCLAEKALEWKSHRINFATKDQLQPEYLRLNPNGVVPTLVYDGMVVTDSSVICEYLEEVFPDNGQQCLPDDLHERAKVRAWLRYTEEVPTASIRFSSFNKLFLKNFSQLSQREFEDHASRLPLRKHFYQKMGQEGFNDSEERASVERLCQTLDRIDHAVSETPWLAGSQFSLADICILPIIVRMEDLEMDRLWQDKAHFKSWYQRMKSRPSYNQAYYPGSHVSLQDEDSLLTDQTG